LKNIYALLYKLFSEYSKFFQDVALHFALQLTEVSNTSVLLTTVSLRDAKVSKI
jgi:hypothetical protein